MQNAAFPKLFIATIGGALFAGCAGGLARQNLTTLSGPQTISNIQTLMSRTTSCSGTPCATGDIAPPTQPPQFYTVTPNVASPSLSGHSTQLQMFPATNQPGDVLYYTPSLGEFPQATNFVWDFWFMIDQAVWDPNGDGGNGAPLAMQALEFDLNDDFPGPPPYDYNFSSQCFMQLKSNGGPRWQIWGQKNDGTIGWIDSEMTCDPAKFTPMVWHHIVWTYRINPSTKTTQYVSLQIDGNPPMIPSPNGGPVTPLHQQARPALEVQFQQDARGVASPAPFTEWVDNVTLTFF